LKYLDDFEADRDLEETPFIQWRQRWVGSWSTAAEVR
jgi:hypothetical protein